MARFLVLLILSSSFLWTSRAATASAAELLENGGFEMRLPDTEVPAGWHAAQVADTRGFVTFLLDEQTAKSGNRSASIAIAPAHPDRQVHYNWTRTLQGWNSGRAYKLTVWVRFEDLGRPPFVMLQFWRHGEKQRIIGGATTQHEYAVMGSSEWIPLHLDFTIPEGTDEVRLRAGISANNNKGGSVWFDEIAITEIGAND